VAHAEPRDYFLRLKQKDQCASAFGEQRRLIAWLTSSGK
jgi:hypothetical protein